MRKIKIKTSSACANIIYDDITFILIFWNISYYSHILKLLMFGFLNTV